MEMEVENPLNEGELDPVIPAPEPENENEAEKPEEEAKEEEDSIFEEMRMLVQTGDTDNETTNEVEKPPLPEQVLTPEVQEEAKKDVDEPNEEEKEMEGEMEFQEETNPQIQMEDLKVAEEDMNEVDVVVCGGCHNVYHFVEDLTRHKPQCSRNSNFRTSAIENKPQVWAFLLWKNAQGKHVSRSGTVVEESSWKLYQKWCKMPERIRNAWIAAGGAVMTYTTFGNKQSAPPTPPSMSPPPLHNVYPKINHKLEAELNGDIGSKPVVMKKLVQRDHTGEIKEIRSTNDPPPPPKHTTLKDEIESIRNQLEGKETGSNIVENGGTLREEEFVVEKIVSRRFNPKKKQYEYLLKWEGYPAEQNTWEPAENLETCQHLLKTFEDNLAKQSLTKTKTSHVKKQVDVANLPGPSTPMSHGRPVRSSKQKALNQVKQWCGSIKPDDVDSGVKRKFEFDSDDDDFLMKKYKVGESDSEDSLMGPPPSRMYKTPLPVDTVPIKRRVGRPPKNRNLVNGLPSTPLTPQPNLEPNLAAALGLESDSEDSPLAVLNQRAAATRVSNLSPLNQQVLVANAKGVVKVDPSQVPNLTSGVYIMSNKSIVKLDSVTPSKALALKSQPSTPSENTGKSEAQVVMIKNTGMGNQKSGIVRKNPIVPKATTSMGRSPRPTGSIRVNTPNSKLQSGIVPRSSVTGVTTGIRPRGSVSNVRVPTQKKPTAEAEKKIFIGTKSVGRGGLKSGIHRKSSIGKVSSDDLENKLRDLKAGDTTDIFEDMPESESSESDIGIPDDFPKEIGPLEPASPPRPLTLCPLTGKVLGKAEGEKTPEPTPPPSPKPPQVPEPKKDLVNESMIKIQTSQVTINPQQTTSTTTPKALFVSTPGTVNMNNSVVSAAVSGMGKPLIVNTSQSQPSANSAMVVSTAPTPSTNQLQETTIMTEPDEDDMVTITGEDGLVYKVSNSDLGSLLGGEDGEQCVYVTEGDDGDTVLALAQYPGSSGLTSLSTDGSTLAASELTSEDQQFYIKQEATDGSELVTLQESEEPQVIAQLVEASEPAPGGQRRVVLLLPDGNLMMTEVDEEQYAALELDK